MGQNPLGEFPVNVVLNDPSKAAVVKTPNGKTEPPCPSTLQVTVTETCSLFAKFEPAIKRPELKPKVGSSIPTTVAETEGVSVGSGAVTTMVFDGADGGKLIPRLLSPSVAT